MAFIRFLFALKMMEVLMEFSCTTRTHKVNNFCMNFLQAKSLLLINVDVELAPYPSVTYRTIGGSLVFHLFLGPTPEDVMRQYHQVLIHKSFPRS